MAMDLNWKQDGKTFNTDTLKGKTRLAYDDYRAKSAAAGKAKDVFEALFRSDFAKSTLHQAGMAPVLSHRFGRLTYVLAPVEHAAPKVNGKSVGF